MTQRIALAFHYHNLSVAFLLDREYPTCKMWILHAEQQLDHLKNDYGLFQEFGQLQLPHTSPLPLQAYEDPAMLWFMQGVSKLWGVRALTYYPPHRNLHRDVLWLEGEHRTKERVRLLMVCAHTAELRFVAIVYSRLQLRELLDKFYSPQRAQEIFELMPIAPLLKSSCRRMLVIEHRQLASDIVQGMIMRRSLVLPTDA